MVDNPLPAPPLYEHGVITPDVMFVQGLDMANELCGFLAHLQPAINASALQHLAKLQRRGLGRVKV